MSLVDNYPHPGPAPEKPSEKTYYSDSKKRWAYVDWVKKLRQHKIAQAVDFLTALPFMSPEQTIAAALGQAYLEDTLSSHSSLGGLF